MERPFDDAAMLHFIRDSLFRTNSPFHPPTLDCKLMRWMWVEDRWLWTLLLWRVR